MDIIDVSAEYGDYRNLQVKLDSYLDDLYDEEQKAYNQYNSSKTMDKILIGYVDGDAIACGAYRKYDDDSVELKRMFVDAGFRNKGYSIQLLHYLETSCADRGFKRIILETGKKQKAAIKFYSKNGFTIIENYGPYKDMSNSICMSKEVL